MTARELAATARRFIRGTASQRASARMHDPKTSGFWPQAAALLGRQALEQALDDFWHAVSPRVRDASRRAQLICIGEFIRDDDLVSGVRHAWHGLSRACHHQVYEVSPTETELSRWLEAVEQLLAHDPIEH
jgi:hypothetical protein